MNPFVLFVEISQRQSPASQDKELLVAAAEQLGIPVFRFPAEWPRATTAAEALADLPSTAQATPSMLSGYIHTDEEVVELYEALAAKNYHLFNHPEEIRRCNRMDECLPLLGDLTPRSLFVQDVDQLDAGLNNLTFPVFIKGASQSRKDFGWQRCVASTPGQARQIVSDLLDNYPYSLGVAVLRELVPLRHQNRMANGFPIAREYRCILFRGVCLACAYYWPMEDPLAALSAEEETAVIRLAETAAGRLGVPFVAVDIAQHEDGHWLVIEAGGPESAGFGHIDVSGMLQGLQSAFA